LWAPKLLPNNAKRRRCHVIETTREAGLLCGALSDVTLAASLAVVRSGHEQPVPIFQQLAGGHPSGRDDVCAISALAAQRRGFACSRSSALAVAQRRGRSLRLNPPIQPSAHRSNDPRAPTFGRRHWASLRGGGTTRPNAKVKATAKIRKQSVARKAILYFVDNRSTPKAPVVNAPPPNVSQRRQATFRQVDVTRAPQPRLGSASPVSRSDRKEELKS
jgi:hypothetical protein